MALQGASASSACLSAETTGRSFVIERSSFDASSFDNSVDALPSAHAVFVLVRYRKGMPSPCSALLGGSEDRRFLVTGRKKNTASEGSGVACGEYSARISAVDGNHFFVLMKRTLPPARAWELRDVQRKPPPGAFRVWDPNEPASYGFREKLIVWGPMDEPDLPDTPSVAGAGGTGIDCETHRYHLHPSDSADVLLINKAMARFGDDDRVFIDSECLGETAAVRPATYDDAGDKYERRLYERGFGCKVDEPGSLLVVHKRGVDDDDTAFSTAVEANIAGEGDDGEFADHLTAAPNEDKGLSYVIRFDGILKCLRSCEPEGPKRKRSDAACTGSAAVRPPDSLKVDVTSAARAMFGSKCSEPLAVFVPPDGSDRKAVAMFVVRRYSPGSPPPRRDSSWVPIELHS